MVSGLQPEAVQTSAIAAMRGAAHPQIQRVRCEFANGSLRLHGRVASFYLKQMAQSIAGQAIPPTIEIDNRLEVAGIQ